MKNKSFLVGTAVIAALFIGLSHAKTNLLEKSFKVKSGGTLYLDSDSGSVQVDSHNRNTVDVVVKHRHSDSEEFNVEFSQHGNDVKISGDRDNSGFGRGLNVRFIIKVPKTYNLDVLTGGGSIELSDLKGTVNAQTSGGSIKLGSIEGDVDVKTSGGSIKVENVAGNIQGHTSGGSITARISRQPTEDCRLTTSGGSVTAYLAPSIAVNLSASTSGGRVRSELDVAGMIEKSHIEGTINGGGPDLYLKTSGGSVYIKEL